MRGVCVSCHQQKTVHADRITKEILCDACRDQRRPLQICALCKEERRDVVLEKATQLPICSKCYKRHRQPAWPAASAAMSASSMPTRPMVNRSASAVPGRNRNWKSAPSATRSA